MQGSKVNILTLMILTASIQAKLKSIKNIQCKVHSQLKIVTFEQNLWYYYSIEFTLDATYVNGSLPLRIATILGLYLVYRRILTLGLSLPYTRKPTKKSKLFILFKYMRLLRYQKNLEGEGVVDYLEIKIWKVGK